jgi:TonB family protein
MFLFAMEGLLLSGIGGGLYAWVMNARNAVLASLLVLLAGSGSRLEANESVTPEDAKVLRAVVGARFPSATAPILVVELTVSAAALDRTAAVESGDPISLRGADFGPNVTVVTRETGLQTLVTGTKSPVMIELSRPEYTSDRQTASVRYRATRHTDKGFRWVTGTVTLTPQKGGWVVGNRRESPEDDPTPLRVGGDVKAPVVVKKVEGVETAEAAQARVSGVVILEIVIDTTGHVTDARVLKPLPFGLNEAAIAAVKQWEFQPGTLHGEPVIVSFNVVVMFTAK